MSKWNINGKIGFCLGADIGASTIRVRLSNPSNPTEYIDLQSVRANCASDVYKHLDDIEKLIKESVPSAECYGSAFSIAGIRNGLEVTPNNWVGTDDIRTIKTQLFSHFIYPPRHRALLNDIEACAYGIAGYQTYENSSVHFKQLLGEKGPIISQGRTAVMALGTGLGSAILTTDRISGKPIVLNSELGYLQASTVLEKHKQYPNEAPLVNYVSDFFYEGKIMPGFEDFSAGRSLSVIYSYFAKGKNGKLDAAQISDLARKGDSTAYQAMKVYYTYYFRLAKVIAKAFECDSIVMALNNQVQNRDLIERMFDDLKTEFLDSKDGKSRNVRVFSQIECFNFNLLGTTFLANLNK